MPVCDERMAPPLVGTLLALLLGATGAVMAQQPAWVAQLGYEQEMIFPVRHGPRGMPFVQVDIGPASYWLLFDTGNMVGLTLTTHLLDRLGLPELRRWNSLDADGRIIDSYRSVRAPEVRVLGQRLVDHPIFEFSDSLLEGLVGPDLLPGTRFTLDYRAQLLAVASTALDALPPNFVELRLTPSARHPGLILAQGQVNGHLVLIEFDTGASRTNVDPALVRDLGLVAVANGVRIDSLALGSLRFSVPSARVNPKSGIDPDLQPPIQLAIGSDILSQLLLTVDYASGRIVLREARRP